MTLFLTLAPTAFAATVTHNTRGNTFATEIPVITFTRIGAIASIHAPVNTVLG